MGNEKGWRDLPPGSVLLEPGNIAKYKTGDWRTFRPVKDPEKCNNCGFCWLYCPDMAVTQTADGDYTFNLDYCKGCGICEKECPRQAIKMVEEGV